MLTEGSTLFGLHAENTFIKGATMEERRQHLKEETVKLTSKVAASTFTYTNNMTFQLEPIDYQNTNDIVANILIPGSLGPCEHWILKDILVQKSPDDLTKSVLSENKFYNVQIMGRAKHKLVNIPLTYSHTKLLNPKPVLDLTQSLSESELISHSADQRIITLTSAHKPRCFKKGHHQIQCKTDLKHIQDIT
ncbi:unnamed protein product [Ambrosiozyma monospora]|uniref:Unnamed protein product n=1 Tax=Ambrosiozyma monospora TaxID=43982 RepID=A0ACB5SWX4_AMBMO|nr:unnamed protein product [Ambrosiozyma monospora]